MKVVDVNVSVDEAGHHPSPQVLSILLAINKGMPVVGNMSSLHKPGDWCGHFRWRWWWWSCTLASSQGCGWTSSGRTHNQETCPPGLPSASVEAELRCCSICWLPNMDLWIHWNHICICFEYAFADILVISTTRYSNSRTLARMPSAQTKHLDLEILQGIYQS